MTAAADHVRALAKKGFVMFDAGKARSIRLTRAAVEGKGIEIDLVSEAVPIFGAIPAGFADERRQSPEGTLVILPEMFGRRTAVNLFALLVQGDSMVGRQIVDGDWVILDSTLEPAGGSVVAALIDGESTLKTFVRDGQTAWLRAENPAYPGQIPGDELLVQGVMIGLIRRG